MSLFDILETRMQGIFESSELAVPIPFKKLAKMASREMKRNSIRVDGRVVAPSLFTVLVSPGDDSMIAPLYQQVTDELVDFVSHEAGNAGLSMVAPPMVRFIADSNVRSGKMSVIAEVVSAEVLDALRQEEAVYAEAHMRIAGAKPKQRPQAANGGLATGVGSLAGSIPDPFASRDAKDKGQLANAGAGVDAFDMPVQPVGDPMGLAQEARPVSVPVAGTGDAQVAQAPSTSGAVKKPSPQPSPAKQAVAVNPATIPSPDATAQRPYHGLMGAACELTDTASGKRWRIGVDSTIIGRDDAAADLVLADTNVSRRHAELKRNGAAWTLTDLGSTNGTRVNGMRVRESVQLNDGDTIQMGLIALAFREL